MIEIILVIKNLFFWLNIAVLFLNCLLMLSIISSSLSPTIFKRLKFTNKENENRENENNESENNDETEGGWKERTRPYPKEIREINTALWKRESRPKPPPYETPLHFFAKSPIMRPLLAIPFYHYFFKVLLKILNLYVLSIIKPLGCDSYIVYSNEILFFRLIKIFSLSTFFQLNLLADICLVDYHYLGLKNRFSINYNLLSIKKHMRFFIIINFCQNNFHSVTSCYSSASWLEREIWDMFGIFFKNNFDLRRILTDYGFKGFPLRKDFPLSGYLELNYRDEVSRIVYKPIEFAQEFRVFSFENPWELID